MPEASPSSVRLNHRAGLSRRFRLRSLVLLVPWLLCAASLMVHFGEMVGSGFERTHRSIGDGRLVNFTLEHGYRWVRQIEPHTDFWKPPIFYPYEHASAFTDTMLGFGPPFWLARLLGAAPDTALQWWMLAVDVLNFLTAYWFFRFAVRSSIVASSLAAVLLSWSAFEWNLHLQLFPIFYILLAMLAATRAFAIEQETNPRRRWLWILLLGACAVAQAWSAVYAFFFFGLLAGIALIVASLFRDTRQRLVDGLRTNPMAWGVCALLVIACLLPIHAHYSETAEERGYRPYDASKIPGPFSWISEGLGEGGRKMPPADGVGVATFAVALIGLYIARRRPLARVLGLASLGLILIGTNTLGFSPWLWVHQWVPGAGGIRAVFRLPMTIFPTAAVGFALVLDRCLQTRWTRPLVILIAVLCVGEHFAQLATLSKPRLRTHIEQIAAQVDRQCSAFLLVGLAEAETPKPERQAMGARTAQDAAWVALASGVPSVTGHYGNTPLNFDIGLRRTYFEEGDEARLARLPQMLRQWFTTWEVSPGEVQWIFYKGLTTQDHRAWSRGEAISTDRVIEVRDCSVTRGE